MSSPHESAWRPLESLRPLSRFAPPSCPTLDQQRDALRKGLGRAMQWAMARRLNDDPLLAACLENQQYDAAFNTPRGDWLWRMIQEVGAVDRFRVPILHALYDLSDELNASQLCELAGQYAAMGDATFRDWLYEVVERKPFADRFWLGEDEIVQLDGEEAFLFAARVRGKSLAGREWKWDDGRLVREASERFGEDRVSALLDDTTDPAILVFRTEWRQQRETKAGQKSALAFREKRRAITVEQILSAADSGDPDLYLFRGWGISADAGDLERILEHLRVAREPMAIVRLLRVFSARAVPRFDERLIELAQDATAEIRRFAIVALQQVQHPLVREFALAELERRMQGRSSLSLLARNYERGDEQRILEGVELPEDVSEREGLLFDVIEVLKANPEADCGQLGVIAYASTPCEMCRLHAAQLLVQRQAAPASLIKECRFDANERIREVAAQPNEAPAPRSE